MKNTEETMTLIALATAFIDENKTALRTHEKH